MYRGVLFFCENEGIFHINHTFYMYCATKEKNKDIKNDEKMKHHMNIMNELNALMQACSSIEKLNVFFIIIIALHQ